MNKLPPLPPAPVGFLCHGSFCDCDGCVKVRKGKKYKTDPIPKPIKQAYIQEIQPKRTSFGTALYIKIRRQDEKPMSWRQVWDVFADRYPDKWAVQIFPPASELVDEINCYHLYVLDEEPQGVNINRR